MCLSKYLLYYKTVCSVQNILQYYWISIVSKFLSLTANFEKRAALTTRGHVTLSQKTLLEVGWFLQSLLKGISNGSKLWSSIAVLGRFLFFSFLPKDLIDWNGIWGTINFPFLRHTKNVRQKLLPFLQQ